MYRVGQYCYCTLDPPSVGTIVTSDELPVKDNNYTLTCQVEDLGRPEALTYTWTRYADVTYKVLRSEGCHQ